MSVHETVARTEKALALFKVFHSMGVDAPTVEAIEDEGWAAAEQLAGTRPASAETRAAVVTMLRDADRAPDPFEGF